jgi:hypothetical protein
MCHGGLDGGQRRFATDAKASPGWPGPLFIRRELTGSAVAADRQPALKLFIWISTASDARPPKQAIIGCRSLVSNSRSQAGKTVSLQSCYRPTH